MEGINISDKGLKLREFGNFKANVLQLPCALSSSFELFNSSPASLELVFLGKRLVMQHLVENGSIGALILNSLSGAKFKMSMSNKWKKKSYMISPCIPCISIITLFTLMSIREIFKPP